MDSGAGTSAEQAPLPVRVRKGAKPNSPRSLAAAAQTRCSTKCAPASETRKPDEAQDPQHRPWEDLPVDILRRRGPRSVCRAWRAAARLYRRPPPPLPLLVLSDFSFASFCAEGTLSGARRHVPPPERETASAGSIRCVDSFQEWLVGVEFNECRYFGDLRCFLMKAFSRDALRPQPAPSMPSAAGLSRSSMALAWDEVVVPMSDLVDIAFCQGKLYMLSSSKFTTDLFAFEISEDNNGLMVSRVEGAVVELPEVADNIYQSQRWRMAEWRRKLLIVATDSADTEFGLMVLQVRVFEADLSINPVRFTEIQNLDGDCIFISPCSNKSFRLCHNDGAGEDLIYLHGNLCPEKFVYNMKDGMMARLAADGSQDKFWAADGMNAAWLFPTG
ncbi:hypothetical protein PR202_ga28706 [Eleusine coracana subsp. coracana]|uniref:KIB1-4 beta-propeller domain-containing protein n=1 Tax=Eleusine coracana subsp. coracana TaxID=191504 RepID=A0AAV5DIZ2_ELECO|nr:hypothetical protein QOZ80_7AG0582730 [Eleusine coracana subsp. coracana]GJN10599.1 hypothetical protein PR202_ga28706 [Eleusine coracana subsp. coracana]